MEIFKQFQGTVCLLKNDKLVRILYAFSLAVRQRLHGNVCVLGPGSLPRSLIRLVH